MVEFASGWRRNCGVCTFLGALVLCGAWIRSYFVSDHLEFSVGPKLLFHVYSEQGFLAGDAEHTVAVDIDQNFHWTSVSAASQEVAEPASANPQSESLPSNEAGWEVKLASYEKIQDEADAPPVELAVASSTSGAVQVVPVGLDINYALGEEICWQWDWCDFFLESDGSWTASGLSPFVFFVIPLVVLSGVLLLKPRTLA